MKYYVFKTLSTQAKLKLTSIASFIESRLVDLLSVLKEEQSSHVFESSLKLVDLKRLEINRVIEEHQKFKFAYQSIDGYLKMAKRGYPVHFEHLQKQLGNLFWVENKNGEIFDIQKLREDQSFDVNRLTENLSEIIRSGGSAFSGRQEHVIFPEGSQMVTPVELAKLYIEFSKNGSAELIKEAVWIADYLRDKNIFFEAGFLYCELYYLTGSYEMIVQAAGCSLLLTRKGLWEQGMLLNQLIFETNHPEVTLMIQHAAKRFEAANQLDFTLVQYTDLYERTQDPLIKKQACSLLKYISDQKNKYRFLILLADEGNPTAASKLEFYLEDLMLGLDFSGYFYLCTQLVTSHKLWNQSLKGAKLLKEKGYFDYALILCGLLYLNKKISIEDFYVEFLKMKDRNNNLLSEFNILSRVLEMLKLEIKEISDAKRYNSEHE